MIYKEWACFAYSLLILFVRHPCIRDASMHAALQPCNRQVPLTTLTNPLDRHRAQAHSCDFINQLARETRCQSCSFAHKDSQEKMLRIESAHFSSGQIASRHLLLISHRYTDNNNLMVWEKITFRQAQLPLYCGKKIDGKIFTDAVRITIFSICPLPGNLLPTSFIHLYVENMIS